MLALIQKDVNEAKDYWDMEVANALEDTSCSGVAAKAEELKEVQKCP
ncbi:MAG: hypothetical protein LWX01_09870 [Deltaproteobacteria bacterium]|nr:hypothetical protein [Deltaproteobacteria bacterium]MDL1961983.1 hypothetical protein [Deltaproteobacteria bacterium]